VVLFRRLTLSGELAERVGEIASGALDAIGGRVQGVDLIRRMQGDDGERCVDLLSQTVCLIFGFLFCAGSL